jgi:hypothetical protein
MKKIIKYSIITFVFIVLHPSFGYGQVDGNAPKNETTVLKPMTVFPQIHTNLNGMVSEFVRSMYQDTKGNYWFGSWQGISLYDGAKIMNAIEKEPWVK